MASNFCGKSGTAYLFERIEVDTPWAAEQGIVLFAAPDAFGWRLIKISALDGREDNIRPIIAFREAQRFGARAVFLHRCGDRDMRQSILEDLKAGLSPVCDMETLPLAA